MNDYESVLAEACIGHAIQQALDAKLVAIEKQMSASYICRLIMLADSKICVCRTSKVCGSGSRHAESIMNRTPLPTRPIAGIPM